MNKKDSIDDLLYLYAEKALNNKYNEEIEYYTNKMEEQNISMDIDFEEFWQVINNRKNKSVIKRKRRKGISIVIIVSLIIAIIAIGPEQIVTYADYIYHKIITVFKEGTTIKYKDDFSDREFVVQKPNYIPKEFILDNEDDYSSDNDIFYSAVYLNKLDENKFIIYSQFTINKTDITLDTENAKTYEKKIDGKTVFVIEQNEHNTILVEFNGCLYKLEGNIDLKILEKILTSIFE